MQSISQLMTSTPSTNHGNASQVPAAVGSSTSARVSGLLSSSSSAITSHGDASTATRRSPRLMERQHLETQQHREEAHKGNDLVDAMNDAAQGNVTRKLFCEVDNCIGCLEKA